MRKWKHPKHAQMAASKTCANGRILNMRKWRAKRAAPVSKLRQWRARSARTPRINIYASHAQGACSSLSSIYTKNAVDFFSSITAKLFFDTQNSDKFLILTTG